MVINFGQEHAQAVRSFHMRQTVRYYRARKIKPGDKLHLYCNARTKASELLAEVICTEVHRVEIGMKMIPGKAWARGKAIVLIDGVAATPEERVSLSMSEGFTGTNEMINYYRRKYFQRIPRKLIGLTMVRW